MGRVCRKQLSSLILLLLQLDKKLQVFYHSLITGITTETIPLERFKMSVYLMRSPYHIYDYLNKKMNPEVKQHYVIHYYYFISFIEFLLPC
jgi:hypothetical protein